MASLAIPPGPSDCAETPPNFLGCPYSTDTVTGCRMYRPVSEHGDFPGAAECSHALSVVVSASVRLRLCELQPSTGIDGVGAGHGGPIPTVEDLTPFGTDAA